MKTVAALAAVTLALTAPALAGNGWRRVHVWTSHGISINAARHLGKGDWRLVYMARNPGTWIHVNLYCGGKHYGENHRVHRKPKRLPFYSSGCKLKVFMLGYLTEKPSGMFMRLELDRR